MNSVLFESIVCPVCGHADFDVFKPARYSGEATEAELRKAYSASSTHQLLDQVVRCRECSMHYVNPRPCSSLIADSYADAEDPAFVAQNEGRARSFRKVLSKVLRSYGQHGGEGRRFLDIGCAGGACLVAARSLGFDPVGVEPSRWMADYGRRTYGVEIHDGILQRGMFPAQSFDFITLWDVLEHVPDPGSLLELVGELLRPDGIFVLSYPDFSDIVSRILGDRWPFWLSVHLLYYDRNTIARQLEMCGFHIDRRLPYWMELPLGYVVKRATPYLPLLKAVHGLLDVTGLGQLPLTYYLSQRIIVARKTASPKGQCNP